MGQYSTYSNRAATESTIVTEGTTKTINTTDSNSEQLLQDILKELKKMNLYNAITHDIVIMNSEVE